MDACEISIIIPVYNTKKDLLDRMLGSILKQNCENLEIIIVDDGSEKTTAEYLDEVSRQHGEVKVIHTVNGGVSKARNTGIEESKGRYFFFADADDELSEGFVSQALDYIHRFQDDIIIGSVINRPEYKICQNSEVPEHFEGKQVDDVRDALMDFNPRKLNYSIVASACGRLFKKEKLGNVKFREELSLAEDWTYMREAVDAAETVLVVPEDWYIYYQVSDSAMHRLNIDNYWDKLRPYYDICRDLNNREPEEVRDSFRRKQIHDYSMIIKSDYLHGYRTKKELADMLKTIAGHDLMRDAVENLKLNDGLLTKKQKMHLYLLKKNAFMLLAAEYSLMNRRNN